MNRSDGSDDEGPRIDSLAREVLAGQAFGDEVVRPRLAATVIVLRGGSDELELLLVKRTESARFMAGMWVFPGGAVDPEDGDGETGLRVAATREAREEAGLDLDADALVPYSRWITPEGVRIRYDTWFFLAELPAGQSPRVDGSEIVADRWASPAGALAAHTAGELALVFPTMKHLQQLAGFPSARALIDHARGRTVQPVQPRIHGRGERARVVLPGEPGYEG